MIFVSISSIFIDCMFFYFTTLCSHLYFFFFLVFFIPIAFSFLLKLNTIPSLPVFIFIVICVIENFKHKQNQKDTIMKPHALLTGDLACNPGMYPDWESNQQPFGSRAGAQSTEPHQPGLTSTIFNSWPISC